jgi:hypothetical protein
LFFENSRGNLQCFERMAIFLQVILHGKFLNEKKNWFPGLNHVLNQTLPILQFSLQTSNPQFKLLREKILSLIKLGSQLENGFLPITKLKEIELEATTEIDTGYKLGKFYFKQ